MNEWRIIIWKERYFSIVTALRRGYEDLEHLVPLPSTIPTINKPKGAEIIPVQSIPCHIYDPRLSSWTPWFSQRSCFHCASLAILLSRCHLQSVIRPCFTCPWPTACPEATFTNHSTLQASGPSCEHVSARRLERSWSADGRLTSRLICARPQESLASRSCCLLSW